MSKNLLLYVHFNRENKLADHVIYQLEHIRPFFDEVCLISNSLLSAEKQQLLRDAQLMDHFIQRENIGFDFKAWGEAMVEYGFDTLKQYDSVTVMNDTCFGPIFDLQPIQKKFEADEQVDFWGMTNNRAHVVDPHADGHEVQLPDHIQSYYVCFKQNVVASDSFKNFWSNIQILDDVVDVIVKYETGMTQYFKEAGFKPGVVFDTRQEDWSQMLVHDFSVFNMSSILEHRIPFLKIKAFAIGAKHPSTPVTVEYLRKFSDYPLDLIIDHMTWYDYPERPYMLNSKMINVPHPIEASAHPKIGIHLHVYYKELLTHYLELFDRYVQNYDLFITTDSPESKQTIEELSQNHPAIKEIIVTGKKGRDVLPWMKIHEKLSNYPIAGHFHTKKSVENWWILGESWRDDLEESLIEPAQRLFEAFEQNDKVGLIISDVPTFQQSFHGPLCTEEEKVWPLMKHLWGIINFSSRKGLQEQLSYVMSYGTMAWYRPAALDNLLAINIEAEIPDEPLPENSILHAFERLLVYTAWGNDFDFRIAHRNSNNGFWNNHSTNEVLGKYLAEIKKDGGAEDNIIRVREIISMLFGRLQYLVKYRLRKLLKK
ncbi:MAG: rhamnan synthesis F family protein [Streptococcaceae bacterium]|jgi:rhamnosyltransferase|nr:rhamnan synthesis F family protein [Streptococcaceae bacterium]